MDDALAERLSPNDAPPPPPATAGDAVEMLLFAPSAATVVPPEALTARRSFLASACANLRRSSAAYGDVYTGETPRRAARWWLDSTSVVELLGFAVLWEEEEMIDSFRATARFGAFPFVCVSV